MLAPEAERQVAASLAAWPPIVCRTARGPLPWTPTFLRLGVEPCGGKFLSVLPAVCWWST
jgi:hypothetical protein